MKPIRRPSGNLKRTLSAQSAGLCLAWVLLGFDPRPSLAEAGVSSPTASSEVGRVDEPDLAGRPPRLVEFVDAVYPTTAQAVGAQSVLLRLYVDEVGRVRSAEVQSAPNPDFDGLAIEAALGFRFEPARRAEAPVAALIEYEYRFTPKEPPIPPQERVPLVARETAQSTLASAGPALAPAIGEAVEVTVKGQTVADRMRESAEAVKVVETEQAKRESADMGEVLARVPGVSVRRSGGLGSGTRFSLNGLTDDQICFFLDGVPLEFSGYGFGVSNVPVNLVSRVEVYSGVVPVRFGADALGGVINLVTADSLSTTMAGASYQIGSFGTHRATAAAQVVVPVSGWFSRIEGFVDAADNDYLVDAQLINDVGREEQVRARRFHDGYQAQGVGVEMGVANLPHARRLSARVFVNDFDKELQNNVTGQVPYGEANLGQRQYGTTLRYVGALGGGWFLESSSGLVRSESRFLDATSCVYDWLGRCVRERESLGETSSYFGNNGADQRVATHAFYTRSQLALAVANGHILQLALGPTHWARSGRDVRLDPEVRDPLNAERTLTSLVLGLSYTHQSAADAFQGTAFLKHYHQWLATTEGRPGGSVRELANEVNRTGGGAMARYRFTEGWLGKASYEWAVRLPGPEEVFGDNAFVSPNGELEPERSHNANVGTAVEFESKRAGAVAASATGFLRETDQLILLTQQYQDRRIHRNVFAARATGVEVHSGWSSPDEAVSVAGSLTQQTIINTSSAGTFGAFEGRRLPHRPSLLAHAEASLQLIGVVVPIDRLILTGRSSWADSFFRGWEGIGTNKEKVDAQLTHSAVLTYVYEAEGRQLSASFDVQNLTGESAYDFFGLEKPGRALYAKITGHFM